MQHLLAYLFFLAVVKRPFQTAQRICLENLKRLIEERDRCELSVSPDFSELKSV
jgi:hypothetical protein